MTAVATLVSEIGLFGRLAAGLVPYFRNTLTPEDCRKLAIQGLEQRDGAFLAVMRDGVFGVASSPYRRMLEHADVGLSDVEALVRDKGLEGALRDLHTAGIYVSLDEFKGRRPIVRGSLTLETRSHDFDNPLSVKHFMSQTGGSRSTGTRVYVDLAHYARDAIYDQLFMEAFGFENRPWGLWRPTPPWGAGIKSLMSQVKVGSVAERWFTQNRLRWSRGSWKHAALTTLILKVGRSAGRSLPRLEPVPLAEAWRVAQWLHECRARGTPAWLNTNCSSGVRVATAALDRGLDISGSAFRLGGEPFTEAKAQAIRAAGVLPVCHYSMGEVGRIGFGCADPDAVDDVHLVADKLAVIHRERTLSGGERVPVNVYTTLVPTTPKLMLNVESDDHTVLIQRQCGCLFGELGYDTHMHTVRSWEKLTSEGMNFLGADLMRLVEQDLPAMFGGGPTDYQFLEEEEQGLPKVTLLVSPRVGDIDPGAVADVVLDRLDGAERPGEGYSQIWRAADTFRVRREEPFATGASKVLALHTTRKKAERV